LDESQVRAEVWKTVQDLNRAWAAEGNAEKLREYFHQNMVAITPSDRERRVGREACVAGWKAFADAAKIHFWKEIDPQINLYGDGKFAVVTYYYDMSFELGGQTIAARGRDMFVLVCEAGRWLVVADQFSPYPKA
jgi:hypothetical protein